MRKLSSLLCNGSYLAQDVSSKIMGSPTSHYSIIELTLRSVAATSFECTSSALDVTARGLNNLAFYFHSDKPLSYK